MDRLETVPGVDSVSGAVSAVVLFRVVVRRRQTDAELYRLLCCYSFPPLLVVGRRLVLNLCLHEAENLLTVLGPSDFSVPYNQVPRLMAFSPCWIVSPDLSVEICRIPPDRAEELSPFFASSVWALVRKTEKLLMEVV